MTFRQVCGFALGLVGVWLMWHTGMGVAEYLRHADGAASWQEALLEPKYSLRVLTALAAFVGGLSALVEKNGGHWLAGLSSFIFGILTFGLIANRADVSEWRNEAIILVMITGLFLTLVVARKESPSEDKVEDTPANDDSVAQAVADA